MVRFTLVSAVLVEVAYGLLYLELRTPRWWRELTRGTLPSDTQMFMPRIIAGLDGQLLTLVKFLHMLTFPARLKVTIYMKPFMCFDLLKQL